MTERRDRWNRCQALAAKLKQQSLTQPIPEAQKVQEQVTDATSSKNSGQ